MKTKLIIPLFLLFVISIVAQPQRPRLGLEQFDANTMLIHLNESLSLTDDQIEQIEPILLQTQTKLSELKNKNYDDDREMMEAHKAVMDKNAELIEKYLTEEQIEKFREIREQRPRFNKGDRPRKGKNRW